MPDSDKVMFRDFWAISYGESDPPLYSSDQPDPDKNNEGCEVGNPVLLAMGHKSQQEVDVALAPAALLQFSRRYTSGTHWQSTALGRHWRHHYVHRIDPVAGSTQMVRLSRPSGNRYIYIQAGDGTWAPDPDVRLELYREGDGWRVVATDGTTEHYDAAGRLVRLMARTGDSVALSYDSAGRLSEVRDPAGRALQFQYDAADRMNGLVGPDGTIAYGYDANGNLSAVTYPDGRRRQYHYEDSRFPGKLTGLTDETGARYATWTYDSQGRAVSSEHAGGAERTTLTYHADGRTTVTNALGKQTTYHFAMIHNVRRVIRVEGHPTASCAGASQSYTYTPEGWLGSKTDWAGNTTTYRYNARGLEISRTEASGTAQARTITTDWHPSLRLPVKITEPSQITEMTYDANGRLLSRMVTPRP
jgi:YD repeat-containing protein